MTAARLVPLFEHPSSSWLRRQGLRGMVRVRLTPDGLGLIGAQGGALEISGAEVEWLRAGVEHLYRGGPWYEARIRVRGRRGALVLRADRPEAPSYGRVIRGLALRVPDVRRLQRGLSYGRGILLVGAMCLPMIFALALWRFALREQPLWQGLVVLALPAALLLGSLWTAWKGWPRTVAYADDFLVAVTPGVDHDFADE